MRDLASALRVIVAALLVALAILIPAANLPVEDVFAMTALFALAFAVVAVTPEKWQRWSPRVQSVSLGGVLEVGLYEAKEAAGRGGEEDSADPATDDAAEPPAPDSLLNLRLKLEAKLAYIAKHMLGTPDQPTFVTVGSLRHDKYLSDIEARTACRVLTWRDEDLLKLSTSQAVEFLGDADKVITNMRAGVLRGMARKRLRDDGWEVKAKVRGGGKRPDIIATKGNKKVRIAAVFVLASESDILDRTQKRLKDRVQKDKGVQKHLVVIPDNSASSPTESDANPRVVKFGELLAAVEPE
jgi:hypothetical protein